MWRDRPPPPFCSDHPVSSQRRRPRSAHRRPRSAGPSYRWSPRQAQAERSPNPTPIDSGHWPPPSAPATLFLQSPGNARPRTTSPAPCPGPSSGQSSSEDAARARRRRPYRYVPPPEPSRGGPARPRSCPRARSSSRSACAARTNRTVPAPRSAEDRSTSLLHSSLSFWDKTTSRRIPPVCCTRSGPCGRTRMGGPLENGPSRTNPPGSWLALPVHATLPACDRSREERQADSRLCSNPLPRRARASSFARRCQR